MTGDNPPSNPMFPFTNLDAAALNAVFPNNQKVIDALSRTQSIDQALRDKLAGTDPDYVKTVDEFDGLSHQQIYEGVHGKGGQGGMSVTTINTLRETWNTIDTELTRIATTHQTSANALLAHGEWAGASGDAVRAGIAALNTSIQQMAQVCEAMKTRLDIVGPAVEAIRMAVQAPTAQIVAAKPDDNYIQVIPGLTSPVVATVDRQAQRQAELDAQATMNRIYTPTIPPTGSGVPSYSVVPGGPGSGGNPDGSGGGSPSAGSPSDGSPNAGSPAASSPTAETPTEPETPATEQEPTSPASTDDDSSAAESPSTTPTDTDDTSPASTAPAATTPTGSTPSGSGSPLGSTGSPLGSGGSPGGLGAPGAGAAVPGQPQSPGVGATLASGGSAAGSRAGTPGMGMMPGAGAGAGRKPGDSDDEHSSPDYLRGVQPELLDTTHVLAGVIGDDPVDELSEPTPNVTASALSAPPVASLLDQPAEAASAPTTSAPSQSSIEPTAPTLPPEVAALLAEHGTTEPAPAGNERTDR
ncbi:hypothetical protein ACFWUP_06715 [Nocardia sp. NPDC058658]|uniref:hypothetical protein n=1 Tax=Nocardia sp. NPDC058658 TaxID=3346580 RepID=UPI00366193ED